MSGGGNGRLSRALPFVVVGYDGSPAARASVQWAARETADLGGELRIVVAWLPDVGSWHHDAANAGRDAAETTAGEAEQIAAPILRGRATLRTIVHQGAAADTVTQAARGAQLLVLGTRGHIGPVGTLLGSVSRRCVRLATEPVVLLGPEAVARSEERVVLTCHGGAAGSSALAWAVRRARRTSRELHVLDTWSVGAMAGDLLATEVEQAVHDEAASRHRRTMAQVRAAVRGTATVTGVLVEGRAAHVEFERTQPGDLLVVPLDDTDHRPSLRYSRCPVVLVPASTALTTRQRRQAAVEPV
jgi:nucleotide-binding universal stress UspA family protein